MCNATHYKSYLKSHIPNDVSPFWHCDIIYQITSSFTAQHHIGLHITQDKNFGITFRMSSIITSLFTLRFYLIICRLPLIQLLS